MTPFLAQLLEPVSPLKPDPVLWWLFRSFLALFLGIIAWFLRRMDTAATTWRTGMVTTVNEGLDKLSRKIDDVKKQVAEQNGSIGEMENEIRLRVEHGQERHAQNMKEHEALLERILNIERTSSGMKRRR